MTSTPTTGLGLATPVARGIFFVYWAGATFLGVMDGTLHRGWAMVLAHALALAGVLLLTARQVPLRPLPAWVLVACALTVLALVLGSIDQAQNYGIVDVAAFLVTLLIPRGNPLAGGIGSALFLLGIGAWLAMRPADPDGAARILAYPVLSLVVSVLTAALLALMLRRERRTLDSSRAAESGLAAAEDFDRGAQDERSRVAALTGPMLHAIAEGRELDAGFRTRVAAAEASVRDGLRAPRLPGSPLDTAISAARSRGVRVVLLGEGLGGFVPSADLIEHLQPLLERADLRALTLRVPSSERPVTAVAELDGSFERAEFPHG